MIELEGPGNLRIEATPSVNGTRTDTHPDDTEANAPGRSMRACQLGPKRQPTSQTPNLPPSPDYSQELTSQKNGIAGDIMSKVGLKNCNLKSFRPPAFVREHISQIEESLSRFLPHAPFIAIPPPHSGEVLVTD